VSYPDTTKVKGTSTTIWYKPPAWRFSSKIHTCIQTLLPHKQFSFISSDTVKVIYNAGSVSVLVLF